MTQRLTLGLRPEAREIRRARAAVDRFCERVGIGSDVHARVRLAVTEAVTNAVLHAHVGERRHVTLQARIDGDDLVVLVGDDGAGIRGLQPGVHRGLGLRIIDRVADAAYISSRPGRGTHVGMRFLLEAGGARG